MRKTAFTLSLLFQLFLTFATLLVIYIIYALLDVEEADMVNEISFIIFQPLFGFILSATTILLCFLVGLPIRLKSNVRQWWLRRPLIPILGVGTGLCLLVIAFSSNLTETKQIILNEETVDKEVPNTVLSISGWVVTAFCLLHFYPQSVISFLGKQKGSLSIEQPVVGQKPSS